MDRGPARPQLRQPRGGRRTRHPARQVPDPGPRVRRRGGVHVHRHRGPGPHGRLEGARRHGHPRHRRRALRPRALGPHLRPPRAPAVDGHGGEPARRHRDPRGHPPHQGRAARGVHHRRAVQRVVRAQPRGAPRAQLHVPPRARRGRPRRGHRPRGTHHPAVEDRRARPRGLPRPHLRPPPRRLRPAPGAPGHLRGRLGHADGHRGPHGVDRRAPPRAAHHRRRPQRPRGRPGRGPRLPGTRRSPSSTTSSWPG